MLGHITILLVYQLVGEVTARLAHLPVPGPVIGMGLLFLTLLWRGGVPESFAATARGLLGHLSLLFVPAGVGVMLHARLLQAEWPAITASLVGSTIITIAVTALIMTRLDRRREDLP
jgi:putative effector of murein hydrolase LrgA (UPF0299 family)